MLMSLTEGKSPPMLRGLSTVTFYADNVAAAQRWYTELLGLEPYFVRPTEGPPAYVEFRIGDYQQELGILDRRLVPTERPKTDSGTAGGALIYWHVDDVNVAFERLISLGATEHDKPVERGPGFVTASVVDPFGNILGVMYNKHYREILDSQESAQ
jgi:predicted enzyme related to lactoylglutathione lyase